MQSYHYYIIYQNDAETKTLFYGEALEAVKNGKEVAEVYETIIRTGKTIIKTNVMTYL